MENPKPVVAFDYDGLEGMNARPFDKSYQEWINNHINRHYPGVKITFDETMVTIDASKSNFLNLLNVVMFIGYAFGQQDNGR